MIYDKKICLDIMSDHIWDFVRHEQIFVGQCTITDSYLQPWIPRNQSDRKPWWYSSQMKVRPGDTRYSVYRLNSVLATSGNVAIFVQRLRRRIKPGPISFRNRTKVTSTWTCQAQLNSSWCRWSAITKAIAQTVHARKDPSWNRVVLSTMNY